MRPLFFRDRRRPGPAVEGRDWPKGRRLERQSLRKDSVRRAILFEDPVRKSRHMEGAANSDMSYRSAGSAIGHFCSCYAGEWKRRAGKSKRRMNLLQPGNEIVFVVYRT